MTTKIEYRNKGRVNCKGNVLTSREPDGTTRVTCDRCALDYTVGETK